MKARRNGTGEVETIEKTIVKSRKQTLDRAMDITIKQEKAPKTKKADTITIPMPDIQDMQVTLVGTTPYLCRKFSDKAQEAMDIKTEKKARQALPARDPQQEYEDCFYILPGNVGYGIPVAAFKKACVAACAQISGIPKTFARGAFHIIGEYGDLTKIHGSPSMHKCVARIGMGRTAQTRYRPQFKEWRVTITVRYNGGAISPEQIINLLLIAGFAVGVGEWRPERDGTFGQFKPVGAAGVRK